jgi:CRP/FNR family transcriptional regulator, cyclic AMP receptor protein
METDAIGYLAAALVLAAFWMRSMSSLRYVAIASNLAFITYGYIGDLMPVLLLHILLLPVNVLRLAELGPVQRDSPGKN